MHPLLCIGMLKFVWKKLHADKVAGVALVSHKTIVFTHLFVYFQEVSCYIDYNVSMPAQNLWRVDIVNRASEDATWDSIRSTVRLIHADSGSALRYSGRQLPPWGFHQHEVVADKVITHQDTQWNVEEHRYTKGN